MSDVMLRFPACFKVGKCSVPSSGIDMTRYACDVEPDMADIPDMEYFTGKPVRPWLTASDLSLLGEDNMA